MLFSDSWWCFCVEFWTWDPLHHEVVFPIVWERLHNLPSYSMIVYTSPLYSLECHAEVCDELLKFCLMQLAIACFMNFLRGLLTQTVVLVWVFCMYFSSLYFLVRPIATLWCEGQKVPRLQFWSRFPKNCTKRRSLYDPKYFGVLLLVLSRPKLSCE